MFITRCPVGMLETNCYLVLLEDKKFLYIIDPGGDPEELLERIDGLDFDRCAVLLTHAHVDHIHALGGICKALEVEYVYLPAADHELYASRDNALEPYLSAAEDLPELTVDPPEDCRVLMLPGHTPGGCGFLFDGHPLRLFSGDTIFAGSIGRTDLPGGDFAELIDSIRSEILTLPDDTEIYPGHGLPTTVGAEKIDNMFL